MLHCVIDKISQGGKDIQASPKGRYMIELVWLRRMSTLLSTYVFCNDVAYYITTYLAILSRPLFAW